MGRSQGDRREIAGRSQGESQGDRREIAAAGGAIAAVVGVEMERRWSGDGCGGRGGGCSGEQRERERETHTCPRPHFCSRVARLSMAFLASCLGVGPGSGLGLESGLGLGLGSGLELGLGCRLSCLPPPEAVQARDE